MNEMIQTERKGQMNEPMQTTAVTGSAGQLFQETAQKLRGEAQSAQEKVQQTVTQQYPPDNLYGKRVKENFHIFGGATFLYACLYAFCMYRNSSGVSYFFFVAGSLVYICYCLSKLGITWRKGNGFYMISMVLLSVSTFCTDDARIIFFNKLGVFLLTISMLLSIAYDTKKWNLGKYLGSICTTCILVPGQLGVPFRNAAWYYKNKLDKKNSRYLYVLAGLVITAPLFVIVLLLLTSADAVFRNMADNLLKGLHFSDMAAVGWMVCYMFFASYCMLVLFCKKPLEEEVKDKRKGEPLIAIPVVTILSVLYLVFSGVQILYLFLGKMQLPEGYTYAEYAREGFFQLLAVGILNLIIVLVCLYYFHSNKLLKMVLTVMSVCTFIMLASSGMRMMIYIQYYYLTFLRILVLWSLGVLFFIFLGVLIYTHKESFPLFRYSMVVVTCMYLCLSFSHPDYWIAKVNVAGMQEDRSGFFKGEAFDDYSYLSTLNADAAPVLLAFMDEEGYDYSCADKIQHYGVRKESFGYRWLERMRILTRDMSLREFNVSRFWVDFNVVSRLTEGM